MADYTQVTVDLAIADASFNVDIAAAEGYRLGPAAFLAMQLRNHMEAMMFKIEQEVLYGANTNGFAALGDELNALRMQLLFRLAVQLLTPEALFGRSTVALTTCNLHGVIRVSSKRKILRSSVPPVQALDTSVLTGRLLLGTVA